MFFWTIYSVQWKYSAQNQTDLTGLNFLPTSLAWLHGWLLRFLSIGLSNSLTHDFLSVGVAWLLDAHVLLGLEVPEDHHCALHNVQLGKLRRNTWRERKMVNCCNMRVKLGGFENSRLFNRWLEGGALHKGWVLNLGDEICWCWFNADQGVAVQGVTDEEVVDEDVADTVVTLTRGL